MNLTRSSLSSQCSPLCLQRDLSIYLSVLLNTLTSVFQICIVGSRGTQLGYVFSRDSRGSAFSLELVPVTPLPEMYIRALYFLDHNFSILRFLNILGLFSFRHIPVKVSMTSGGGDGFYGCLVQFFISFRGHE